MSEFQERPTSGRVASAKPQRVLACVLCQQRKVKCDRKFPCINCVRAGVQCVPGHAVTSRQRRRRFPERDLLDRIRHYEDLLRQHNIDFEPLHSSPKDHSTSASGSKSHETSPQAASGGHEDESQEHSGEKEAPKAEIINIWNAWNQSETPDESDENQDEDHDSDSSQVRVRHASVKKALEHMYETGDDQIWFGARVTLTDLSTLHPPQVHIFRLWQIYLDNINPLLKITHTPTLQPRIVNAIGNLANIDPPLEALMFSIYCITITCLPEDECLASFGSPSNQLLASYRYGCQQALLKCNVLRTNDRECLTAYHLYLLTIKPISEPRALSTMLGAALRIAQHMRMHSESANAKYPALEAEMRRRLWWSLVLFDARISEQSDFKAGILVPTWDCATPSNVNDFDLRPEMKVPPSSNEGVTEATFAVVRSELADFIRYSTYYLDFYNPMLKPVVADNQLGNPQKKGGDLAKIDKIIDDRYLNFCDEGNVIHFMTKWTTKGYLAKQCLFEQYQRHWKFHVQQTDEQRDIALCHALDMFECDTKLLTSSMTKGFWQHITNQFPFPAYIHAVQDLRRRPYGKHAERAWTIMSDNYKARLLAGPFENDDNPLTKILSKQMTQAWEAFKRAPNNAGKTFDVPLIVQSMQRQGQQTTPGSQYQESTSSGDLSGLDGMDVSATMPMGFGGQGSQYNMSFLENMQQQIGASYAVADPATTGIDMGQLDLTAMDWDPMRGPRW